MLPAFALFPAFAVLAAIRVRPQWSRLILGFCARRVDCRQQRFPAACTTPLVLQEAKANAATRIPFEQALANKLIVLPPQATLLMYTSAHIGALQQDRIFIA